MFYPSFKAQTFYCLTHSGGNSSGSRSSHHTEEPLQKPVCLLLSVLGAAILALVNSVALLVHNPQCLRGSGSCSLMVYLDPCFSLLALVILFATCVPQVRPLTSMADVPICSSSVRSALTWPDDALQVSRHGMLLLQATPPHVSISDLQRRIESVPGVQAVHDLHIWELTELFWVASVHVHCHADFKTHR